MTTNTYRLAVALQAKAIDSIDLHAGGVYTAAHSFGENITVVARYRTGADQRILQMWAHDADAHLLGSAEASTPLGGGVIASHITAFRGDHLRWERRIIPTAEQYRNPAALAIGAHPSQACRVPLLWPRRLLPQPRLGTRALATRHHLVTARRNHAQRSTRRPDQGRRRHRHQLRGRARDPPPGRRLTRPRAPGSPPRGPGHIAASTATPLQRTETPP